MSKLSMYFSVMVLAMLSPNGRIKKRVRFLCQRRISRYFKAIGH